MKTRSIFVVAIMLIFYNRVEAYPKCLQSHEDEGRLTLKILDQVGICNSDCVLEKSHFHRYNSGYHYSYFRGRYCSKQELGTSCTGGTCQGYINSLQKPELCFSASTTDDKVRFKSSECTPFKIKDGKFFIGTSTRCLQDVPNAAMIVVDDCDQGNGTPLEFVVDDQVIKITGTNKCIHPLGGQPNENTPVSSWGDCNPQARFQYAYNPI